MHCIVLCARLVSAPRLRSPLSSVDHTCTLVFDVSVEWVADVTINGRVDILFNMTDMVGNADQIVRKQQVLTTAVRDDQTRTTSMFEQQFSTTAFGTSMGRWTIGYLLAE